MLIGLPSSPKACGSSLGSPPSARAGLPPPHRVPAQKGAGSGCIQLCTQLWPGSGTSPEGAHFSGATSARPPNLGGLSLSVRKWGQSTRLMGYGEKAVSRQQPRWSRGAAGRCSPRGTTCFSAPVIKGSCWPHTPLGLSPAPREPWVLPLPPSCSPRGPAEGPERADYKWSPGVGAQPKFTLPARTWLPPWHSR